MGFKITFTNNNDVSDGHKVYRSQTSMEGVPVGDLPEPVAVLPPGIDEWEDGTVIEGETYFYMVSAYIGSGQAFSDEIEVVDEGGAPEIIRSAIFSFTTSSLAQAPVNRVLYSEGLDNGLDINGQQLTWGIEYVSGQPSGTGFYTDHTYDGLPWPHNPVVDTEGDYQLYSTLRTRTISLNVTGLDIGKKYKLRFTGSRFLDGRRVIAASVLGNAQSVSAVNNNTRELIFESITPDSEGKISFVIDWGGSTYTSYLSALYIQEVEPNGD